LDDHELDTIRHLSILRSLDGPSISPSRVRTDESPAEADPKTMAAAGARPAPPLTREFTANKTESVVLYTLLGRDKPSDTLAFEHIIGKAYVKTFG
jgi:hypothetical protein